MSALLLTQSEYQFLNPQPALPLKFDPAAFPILSRHWPSLGDDADLEERGLQREEAA